MLQVEALLSNPTNDLTIQDVRRNELHWILGCFVDWSKRSRWHEGKHSEGVHEDVWGWMLDNGLLKKTADVLMTMRVPRRTAGNGPDERQIQQVLKVLPFYGVVLEVYSIMVTAVQHEVAPWDLHTEIMHHILEPKENGFMMMITDILEAMLLTAEQDPMLFHVGPRMGSTPPPHAAMQALHGVGSSSMRLSSAPISPSRTPAAPATPVSSPHRPAIVPKLNLLQSPASPTVSTHGSGISTTPSTAVTPAPGTPTVTALISTTSQAATTSNPAALTSTSTSTTTNASAPATAGDDAHSTAGSRSYISRDHAVLMLRLVRQLCDVTCRETSRVVARMSMREFLGSMLAARASLAGVLHELQVGHG